MGLVPTRPWINCSDSLSHRLITLNGSMNQRINSCSKSRLIALAQIGRDDLDQTILIALARIRRDDLDQMQITLTQLLNQEVICQTLKARPHALISSLMHAKWRSASTRVIWEYIYTYRIKLDDFNSKIDVGYGLNV